MRQNPCPHTVPDVLTYSFSPEYRPDIDNLSPVQVAATEVIREINMASPGVPSLILHDLSEYATLPFMAAFDVPSSGVKPQKRVSYIALSKKTMPQLVDLFLKFKTNPEIYTNGTLEAVLSVSGIHYYPFNLGPNIIQQAYSIPIKLKYDCPAPSKFGKDQPLWKTATTGFLVIVREFALQLKNLGDG